MSKAKKAGKNIDVTPEQAALLYAIGKEVEHIARTLEPCSNREASIMVSLEGFITMGHAGKTTATAKPDYEKVIAWILGRLNTKGRQVIMDDFASITKETTELPSAPDEAVSMTKLILARLTTKNEVPRAGSLTSSVKMSEVNMSKLTPSTRSKVAEVSRQIDLDLVEA
jgi:hypothetical protein